MKIRVQESTPQVQVEEPTVFLVPTTWDDYSYKTEFIVYYAGVLTATVWLGRVKILARVYPKHKVIPLDNFTTRDVLPPESAGLPQAEFCSLGQDTSYYSALAGLPPGTGTAIADALADVTREPVPLDPWWRSAKGFEDSLLRLASANMARLHGAALLRGETVDGEYLADLRFKRWQGRVLGGPETFDATFNARLQVPGRVHVIVGKNGVGKTSLLAGIAKWLDSENARDKWTYVPTFSRVVILSNNPFDDLASIRQRKDGNVRFLGEQAHIRSPKFVEFLTKLKSEATGPSPDWPDYIATMFPTPADLLEAVAGLQWSDLRAAPLAQLASRPDWVTFLHDALGDPVIAAALLEAPKTANQLMSAGQRSLVSIWASLFDNVAPQSLLLLDEPENFLHPSLIARFARALNELLELRKSFAIIATHSPILAQETPARFVSIFEREGDTTTHHTPNFETFGESIDNLTERLFETDFKSSHWKKVLRHLAASGAEVEQVQMSVSGIPLSLSAESYFYYQRAALRK